MLTEGKLLASENNDHSGWKIKGEIFKTGYTRVYEAIKRICQYGNNRSPRRKSPQKT